MANRESIAYVWNTRYHRSGPDPKTRQTKEWIFYISRPGLELLRKTDTAGKLAYKTLKKTVEEFLKNEGPATGYTLPFTIKTNPSIKENKYQVYATLAYPFDVKDEVKGKKGVLIHLGEGEAVFKEQQIDSERSNYPSMFESKFKETFIQALISEDGRCRPPGTKRADPMWMEFPSSKVLPTDQLLDPEMKQGKFRTIISHQFIEIRLISGKNEEQKSSREQVDALVRYSSFDSGYTHFAGAPGTGKSTLLHMIVSHRIFENYLAHRKNSKRKKILYYVPSPYLKEEARREIRTILEVVYIPQLKHRVPDAEKDIFECFKEDIFFVTQEDLFLTHVPPRKFNLVHDDNAALKNELGIKQDDKLTEERMSETRRGIRRVILGLYGEKGNFDQWVHSLGGKSIQESWKRKKISLAKPSIRESLMHDLTLEQFHAASKLPPRQLIEYANRLPIYNGESQNQFWDASSIIYQSSKLSGHPDLSVWKTLKGKVDCIVIDEIQDISISEVRILFEHFSNRNTANQYADFRVIGAGDENQNVKGLIYMPNNKHFRFLYSDWIQELRQMGKTLDGMHLSHDLKNFQDETLSSSYRVFDEMVPYATQILKHLRHLHESNNDAKKAPPAKMVSTKFGRRGIFVTCNTKLPKKDETQIDNWGRMILSHLKSQLDLGEETPTIRVALTYDEGDIEPSTLSDEANPWTARLEEVKHRFGSDINDMLQEFSNRLVKKLNIEENNDNNFIASELRRELALRGVMSVKDIKGLTVPISIVIPPRDVRPEQGKLNADALSKFLVQITRSQYCNVLIEEVRVLENRKAIDTRIEDDLTDWLSNILEHSVGFNQSFNNLFEATLNEYESFTLWERLLKRSESINSNLFAYVGWLENFHAGLKNGINTLPETWDSEFVKRKKEKFSLIGDEGKSIALKDISEIEEEFFLGTRISEPILLSLKLFVLCNSMIRRELHGGGGISAKLISETMFEWHKHHQNFESLDFDKALARDWFEILVSNHPSPEAPENTVLQAIEETFTLGDQWKWPNLSLPRLNMGSWRLKQCNSSLADKEEKAWMAENSSFYNLTPGPLLAALNATTESQSERTIKIRLMLGMISLDDDCFSKAICDSMELEDESQSDSILEWFMHVFANDDKRAEFKNKVRVNLEHYLKNTLPNSPARKAFSHYLARINSIPHLEQILEACQFKEWHKCVKVQGMLEQSIHLAHDQIKPRLEKEVCLMVIDSVAKEIKAEKERFSSTQQLIKQRKGELERWIITSDFNKLLNQMGFTNEVIAPSEILSTVQQLKANDRWPMDKNIELIDQFNEQIDFIEKQETRLADYDKRLKKLDDQVDDAKNDLQIIHETHGNLDGIQNPFRLGGNIYNFFKNYYDQEDESVDKIHRSWFSLLYGMEAVFNGKLPLTELTNLGLVFPKMNSDFLKKIHVLVDFFITVDETNINRIATEIDDSLSPRKLEKPWLTPLMLLLDSIETQYSQIQDKEFRGWLDVRIMHQKKRTTLDERLVSKLIKSCGDLQNRFVEYIFNQNPDETTLLNQEQLTDYLCSERGRFVYGCIFKTFATKDTEMLDLWRKNKWVNKNDFSEFVRTNTVNSIAPSKHGRLALHHPWSSPLEGSQRLEPAFVSGATFRALSALASNDLEMAQKEFKNAGLNHYAAALSLREASDGGPLRFNMMEKILEILKNEEIAFINALHVSMEKGGRFDQRQFDENKNLNYQFGKQLHRHLEFDGSSNLNLNITNRAKTRNRWFLQFCDIASRVDHAVNWHSSLSSMFESIDDPDLWLQELDNIKEQLYPKHTLFWDTRIDTDGVELDATVRFKWTWSDKKGYQQVGEPKLEFKRKHVLYEFLQAIFQRNPVPNKQEIALEIEKVTGADGAVLVLLNPERCKLEMEQIEDENTAKRRIDNMKKELIDDLSGFKRKKEYDRRARHSIEKILDGVKNSDIIGAMESLAYSTGLRNDDAQSVKIALIEIAVELEIRLPKTLIVEDLTMTEEMALQRGIIFLDDDDDIEDGL